MQATPHEIEEFLSALKQNPKRISSLIARFDDGRLRLKADRKTWSANEILAHIRSCADVWGQSIESMLAENHPKLSYIHPRQWVKRTNYFKLDFSESFKAFLDQRKKVLQMLNGLSFEDWQRGAVIQGKVHTVFSQVRRMAKHEMEHCEQLESLLK